MPTPRTRRAAAAPPRSTLVGAAFVACTLLAHAPALGAQEAARPTPAQPAPPPQRNSIAGNLLGIPFGLFSLEYERALTVPGLTVGLGGSHFAGDLEDDDDTGGSDRNSWLAGKLHYYPSERAFRGFSVGLTAGVHSTRGDACDFDDVFGGCRGARAERRTQTGATLGVLVNYDRIVGSRERVRVGLGLGAKRVLRDVRDRDVLQQVYPDGRFVVGFTF